MILTTPGPQGMVRLLILTTDGVPCQLQLQMTDREIRLLDPDRSCQAFCGMRGSIHGAIFPLSARRTIRYLERLKGSAEYKEAMAEAAQ